MSRVSESDSGSPNPHASINHDYITSEKNDYTALPPTFNGESTEFEWQKRKMYTNIIGLNDELWDILEDDIYIQFNGVGMITDSKTFTPFQKKTYTKHIELDAF